jgi:pre-mRNA cleavage complex 2 protein Pcf11
VDPFRTYYADRLRELTFNSRPIIQELSLLAMQQRDQNQWANMTAVVEEIEIAVYRVRIPRCLGRFD